MTGIIVTVTTLFCMFFLTGCATIMSHGPQTLPILTQPDGAECEITDVTEGSYPPVSGVQTFACFS